MIDVIILCSSVIVFIALVIVWFHIHKPITRKKASSDIQIARRIQRGILPKNINTPGLTIAAFMKSADLIGGDYYDINHINNTTWITIGDAVGHGMEAGITILMVNSVTSTILAQSDQLGNQLTPAYVNYIANKTFVNSLRRLGKEDVITILTIAIKDNILTVSGAHDNFYIYRYHNNCVETISVDSFPIGLGLQPLERHQITEQKYNIEDNDLIVIVTDGVTEAPYHGNYKLGVFGEDRLINFIRNHAHLPVEITKGLLVAKLNKFTNNKYCDDACFIIIRKDRS